MFCGEYSDKRVSFPVRKKLFNFHLSRELFSSQDIDAGTKLLLNICLPLFENGKIKSVLDIGCGTGILGIALAGIFPGLKCVLIDRDALAVNFAEENARINKVWDNCRCLCLPAFSKNLGKFDLIVSNIPAKAGDKVIRGWIAELAGALNENGRAALIIVKPLAGFLSGIIAESEYKFITRVEHNRYDIFVLGNKIDKTNSYVPLPDFYFRGESGFNFFNRQAVCDTVYGMGEFDELSFSAKCAADAIGKNKFNGPALFVNPGQGHLANALYNSSKINGTCLLAGRDSLSLAVAKHNIIKYTDADILYSPCLENEEIDKKFGLICLNEEYYVSRAKPRDKLLKLRLLCLENAFLLIYGRSSGISRYDISGSGFSLISRRKKKGFCAILLKKVL